MNDVATKLREARAMIEKGWTRGVNCRDGRVCTLGALAQAFRGDAEAALFGPDYRKVFDLFWEATGGGENFILWDWNDKQPSKKPVLAAFDKAIEIAEQSA